MIMPDAFYSLFSKNKKNESQQTIFYHKDDIPQNIEEWIESILDTHIGKNKK